MDALEVKKVREITSDTFFDHVCAMLEGVKENLLEFGNHSIILVISDNGNSNVFRLSDVKEECIKEINELQRLHPSIDYYMLFVESWGIVVPDKQYKKYEDHPELIFENPFKEEMIVFEAQGFGQKYAGEIPFERDDKGNVVIHNWKFNSNRPALLDKTLASVLK